MRNAITLVLNEFFRICLLQKCPQDLPASPVLFWPVLFSYGAISAILLLPTLITFVFLYLCSVPRRWLQTGTALAGTGLIFSLIAVPLFYWRVFFEINTEIQTMIGLLVLVLVIWNVAVMTHILRHALSASYMLGILGSVTYITLTSLVLQIVLPVEGGM